MSTVIGGLSGLEEDSGFQLEGQEIVVQADRPGNRSRRATARYKKELNIPPL